MEIINGVIIAGISAFIIWIASSLCKKYRIQENQELFIVTDTKITQKALHPCIPVRFKSNDAVVEFQKRGGKLVGYDNLIGWVRQDCPILQKHMNSWSFKFKHFLVQSPNKNT